MTRNNDISLDVIEMIKAFSLKNDGLMNYDVALCHDVQFCPIIWAKLSSLIDTWKLVREVVDLINCYKWNRGPNVSFLTFILYLNDTSCDETCLGGFTNRPTSVTVVLFRKYIIEIFYYLNSGNQRRYNALLICSSAKSRVFHVAAHISMTS